MSGKKYIFARAGNNIVQGWEVAYSEGTASELSLGDRRGKGSESASRDKSEGTVDTVKAFTDDADGRSGYKVMVDVGGGVEAGAEGSWRGGWRGAERAGVGFIPPDKVEPGPDKRACCWLALGSPFGPVKFCGGCKRPGRKKEGRE